MKLTWFFLISFSSISQYGIGDNNTINTPSYPIGESPLQKAIRVAKQKSQQNIASDDLYKNVNYEEYLGYKEKIKLGKKIKAKYPQYEKVDDIVLADKFIAKYGKYDDREDNYLSIKKSQAEESSQKKRIGTAYEIENFEAHLQKLNSPLPTLDELNEKLQLQRRNSMQKPGPNFDPYDGMLEDPSIILIKKRLQSINDGIKYTHSVTPKLDTKQKKTYSLDEIKSIRATREENNKFLGSVNNTKSVVTVITSLLNLSILPYFIIAIALLLTVIFRKKNYLFLKALKTHFATHFKTYISILAIPIIILFFTNPSRQEFASYLHWSGTKYIGRDKNYFIFSIYSFGNPRSEKREVYIGILGNFYRKY